MTFDLLKTFKNICIKYADGAIILDSEEKEGLDKDIEYKKKNIEVHYLPKAQGSDYALLSIKIADTDSCFSIEEDGLINTEDHGMARFQSKEHLKILTDILLETLVEEEGE